MGRVSTKYVILGDPSPLFTRYKANPVLYCKNEQVRMVYEQQLQDQLVNFTPFKGPLQLDLIFFLPMPRCSVPKKKELEGVNNHTGTSVDVLLEITKLLRRMGIYQSECLITALHVQKLYSADPRIEFSITELS